MRIAANPALDQLNAAAAARGALSLLLLLDISSSSDNGLGNSRQGWQKVSDPFYPLLKIGERSNAKRDPTRREHFLELLQEYNWRSFGLHEYREMSAWLMNQAGSSDQGITLIALLISQLRHRRIVVPVLPVLERLTIAARSRARRKAYRALNGDLTFDQRRHLDRLLELRDESRQTWLGWLRQAIGVANPNNILACIERLTFIRQLHIPIEWARRIHQNRLVQIAREGAGTDAAHLRSFSPERRYATLVATVLDTATILIDETGREWDSGLRLISSPR